MEHETNSNGNATPNAAAVATTAAGVDPPDNSDANVAPMNVEATLRSAAEVGFSLLLLLC